MASTTTTDRPKHEASTAAPGTGLKILIADKFEQSGIDAMQHAGFEVHSIPDLTAESMPDAVREFDPEVIIVRSTKVPEAVFEAADRLSLVVRAGAGTDNIDVAAASARGVFVANCPGKNALAVAELTWALILACDRRVPEQTIALREGRWDKKGFADARGLYGRTLGIVGLGRIGLAVADRGRAFGMDIIAWSRSLTPETAEAMNIRYCGTPIDVARNADVISIHVASTPDTQNLVDSAFCEALREGAIFVNTSRGAVVDEGALAKAIRAKGVRVGLDVYAEQPAPTDETFSDSIVHEPNVCGTHHIGASTDQAQQAISAETVRIVESYATTGVVPNCMNRAAASTATCLLTVRHLNRSGVLAHVFHILSDASINVEEMENIIYDGAHAACARIRLDSKPTGGQLSEIRSNENILSVGLTSVPQ